MSETKPTDLHEGMKNRAAKDGDSSMKPPSGKSVNDSPTRSSTGGNPSTIGPRCA